MSNSTYNPRDLLRSAQAGDTEAFGVLYEEYYTPVFRYLYARLKHKEDTEDLAQTVFVKAFNALNKYKEQSVSPLAYFFTIARNTLIDHWRKTGRRKDASDSEEILSNMADTHMPSTISILEHADDSSALSGAISELTDEQQEVITLRFISGLSSRETSEIIGKSDDAVRQLQARALRTLHTLLKDYDR